MFARSPVLSERINVSRAESSPRSGKDPSSSLPERYSVTTSLSSSHTTPYQAQCDADAVAHPLLFVHPDADVAS